MAMISVQRGRGGWVSSSSTLAKAIAIASVWAVLVVAGCSKKPAPVGAENPGANQLGEGGTGAGGGTTQEDWEKGTIGRGGPLSDIYFGYNDFTIGDPNWGLLNSNTTA